MAKVSLKELEECFVEHLPYEIGMLRQTYASLASLTARPDVANFLFEQNLLIECFCLHARNMIEFFKSKDSSDFNPRDFTVAGYSLRTRFVRDSMLPKINEQLSHLSRKRTAVPSEKLNGDDFNELKQAIEGEILRMVESLTPSWKSKCKFAPISFEVASGGVQTATNHISIAPIHSTDVRTVGS